jgi:mannan endo-1,4-beta-mannosidase
MRSVLQFVLGSLALSTALPSNRFNSHDINQDDFVYVKGLRLYDAKGLHYITGNPHLRQNQAPMANWMPRD